VADVTAWFRDHENRQPTPARNSVNAEDGLGFIPEGLTPDPWMCVVLKSAVNPTDPVSPCTYHLIWPCVWGPRFSLSHSVKEFLKTPKGRVWARAHADVQCLFNGSLRGYLCDKYAAGTNLLAHRPFVYAGVLNNMGLSVDFNSVFGEPPGDGGLREDLWQCAMVWKATTIRRTLVDRDDDDEFGEVPPPRASRKRATPEPDTPSTPRSPLSPSTPSTPRTQTSTPRPPTPVEESIGGTPEEHLYFINSTELFNPGELDSLCSEAAAQAREREAELIDPDALKHFLRELFVPFINKHMAQMQDTGSFVVRQINSDSRLPALIKLQAKQAKMFLSGGTMNIPVGRKVKQFSAWDVWLGAPGRLTFSRFVVLPPPEVHPREFNLFRGYEISEAIAREYAGWSETGALTGREISADTVAGLIHSFLCDGNPEVTRHVISWMAHLLQRPLVKLPTALVFISEEGIGKDMIFTEIMGAIIGKAHFVNSADPELVSGKFNAQLEGKVLVVFNEAEAIESNVVAKLKNLITEREIRIEHKGFNPYQGRNNTNLILNTNVMCRPLMAAGPAARRWVVSDCNSSIGRDHDFWTDFVCFLGIKGHQRGIKAWAHFLNHLNIDLFNFRVLVCTRALVDMKMSAMNSAHQWWLACLTYGRIIRFPVTTNEDANLFIEESANWIDSPIEVQSTPPLRCLLHVGKDQARYHHHILVQVRLHEEHGLGVEEGVRRGHRRCGAPAQPRRQPPRVHRLLRRAHL
jgi:hypothetical protein